MTFNRDRNFTDASEKPVPRKYRLMQFPHTEGRFHSADNPFYMGGKTSYGMMNNLQKVKRPEVK
jgi:hypothetical protein